MSEGSDFEEEDVAGAEEGEDGQNGEVNMFYLILAGSVSGWIINSLAPPNDTVRIAELRFRMLRLILVLRLALFINYLYAILHLFVITPICQYGVQHNPWVL